MARTMSDLRARAKEVQAAADRLLAATDALVAAIDALTDEPLPGIIPSLRSVADLEADWHDGRTEDHQTRA